MNGSREIWAIIPARGGSKGLPRKNILPLRGIPLIAWSIAPAKSAKNIDRVIVSTDDREIADIARSYGAEIPFLRPANLAGDKSLIGDAIDYTVDRIVEEGGYAPLGLCILYPTYPFRSSALIDAVAAGVSDYIFVGVDIPSDVASDNFVRMDAGGYLRPIAPDPSPGPLYYPSGVAYGYRYVPPEARIVQHPEANLAHVRSLLDHGEIKRMSKKIIFVDDPRAEVDIDARSDLELAERLASTEDIERVKEYECRGNLPRR